jgi:hypothetical protein
VKGWGGGKPPRRDRETQTAKSTPHYRITDRRRFGGESKGQGPDSNRQSAAYETADLTVCPPWFNLSFLFLDCCLIFAHTAQRLFPRFTFV